MQTDYAQILPIVLPTPKAGSAAPIKLANADGKAASSSSLETVDPEAVASEDNSTDPSEKLSAFDQALAQMMMVQVQPPAAQPVPQAPSQQGLTTNAIDITAALTALQPSADLAALSEGLAAQTLQPAPQDVGAQSGPLAASPAEQSANFADLASATRAAPPPSAAPLAAHGKSGLGLVGSEQASNAQAKRQPSDPASIAVPSQAADGGTAVVTPPAPLPVEIAALQSPAADIAPAVTPGSIPVQAAPVARPEAPILQALANAAQGSLAENAPTGPSDPMPIVAAADRSSSSSIAQASIARASIVQAPIVQAMGNAASDPSARVTGVSVPPQDDPSAPLQPVTAQVQSDAAAKSALQAASAVGMQGSISAQAASREAAQATKTPIATPLVSNTSTSTPVVATPPTANVIVATAGTSSANTGGAFEEAPSDFSEPVPVATTQSESEATTDIFGAPLPLEGRVTQASLQQGSTATLSTPATAPHLAAEISRKFEGKSAQFDISLTPEGLGKVDVKITINARGEVSAAMKFDNPQAAAELKGRAAELQRALEQSGFSLSRDGISFTDGQGQGFGAPQQQASQQDWQETARRTAQNRLFQDTNDLADAAALRVAEASSAYSRRSNTGVDVRI